MGTGSRKQQKKIVDAAEKVKRGYFDKGMAKMRMLFGSHQVLRSNEDNDNCSSSRRRRGSGSRHVAESESDTESSPSGYGTETSDSSSDTDIDAVVNEYREEASLPTTMRECSRSDLELKGPNRATANVVLMATMVLLLSFGLQFVILDNVKSATMVNAVILNLGICVAVFVLLLVISKQPADKERGRTDFTFIMPLAPWTHALAMFLNLSLMARVLHSAWLEMILWIALGCFVYFCYGINHSRALTDPSHPPNSRGGRNFRRERPNTLMLSPVPISSIPTDVSSSAAAANYTPTFDLTTLSNSKTSEERSSIVKSKRQFSHQPLLEK